MRSNRTLSFCSIGFDHVSYSSILCGHDCSQAELSSEHGHFSDYVLKKGLPVNGRVHIGYCCRKYGQIRCYKKTRFYCSTCTDEDNKFYYCQGFYSITVETRTCFLEHQHTMSLGYGWLICLSPFHPLLYLLNLFCACFLSVPFITPCIVFVHCLNVCDYSLVR